MRISDWSSDVCSSDLKSIISPASPERTNFVERIQETIAPMPIAAAHKIEEGDAPRASRLQADLASRIVRMLKEQGAGPGHHLVELDLCRQFDVSRTDRKSTRLNSSH